MRYLEAGRRHAVSFILNGRTVRGEAEPRMLLSDFLRQVIGATGTHVGCEHGVCGACTIRVDGRATRACLMLAVQADGKSLDTIEGLANGDDLHPVQEAWLEEDVPACGWCQSGQIMAAVALLKENPNPSDEEIKQKMVNYCRCGTYLQIFAAVKKAVTLQGETA